MRRLALGLLLVVWVSGCVTPSIPIPPPDPARMTFEVTDGPESTASFSYAPEANYVDAIVYVFNRDRGTGVFQETNPDGSAGPTAPLGAALGEQIVVTFEREDQTVSTCIRLRNGVQSSTDPCGP